MFVRSVGPCACSLHQIRNHLMRLILFFGFEGIAWTHGCRYMFDRILSLPHCGEWVTGSNLYHLGPKQTLLRHTAERSPSTCLSFVHQ